MKRFSMKKVKGALAAVAVSAMTVPGAAMATSTNPDFSGILTGLAAATAVTAIVAAAAIIAVVNFSGWGSKKVAGFIK